MKIALKIALICVITLLVGCGTKSPCLKGQGEIISQVFPISGFNEISVYDNINVELKEGPESVKVEAGENMMPYIKLRRIQKVLELHNDNKCEFLRNYKSKVKVTISSPNIEKFTYYGIGDITSIDTLKYLNFLLESHEGMGNINLTMVSNNILVKEHSGSANITITGSTNYAYYYLRSTGWFDFKNLISNEVYTVHQGYGDISLYSENDLRIEKNSYGNIEYYGNPNLNVVFDKGPGIIIKK